MVFQTCSITNLAGNENVTVTFFSVRVTFGILYGQAGECTLDSTAELAAFSLAALAAYRVLP